MKATHPKGPWNLHSLEANGVGEPRWSVGVNGPRAYLTCDEETAKLIVRAVNAHEDLLAACEAIAPANISKCDHCNGTGRQCEESDIKDACHTCGGVGELVGFIHPDDIRQVRAALSKARARGERGDGK